MAPKVVDYSGGSVFGGCGLTCGPALRAIYRSGPAHRLGFAKLSAGGDLADEEKAMFFEEGRRCC